MNSAFLRLGWADFGKGLFMAVLSAVIATLNAAFEAGNFDFATYDWGGILKLSINVAGVYLIKNLLSDKDGKVLGVVG